MLEYTSGTDEIAVEEVSHSLVEMVVCTVTVVPAGLDSIGALL